MTKPRKLSDYDKKLLNELGGVEVEINQCITALFYGQQLGTGWTEIGRLHLREAFMAFRRSIESPYSIPGVKNGKTNVETAKEDSE